MKKHLGALVLGAIDGIILTTGMIFSTIEKSSTTTVFKFTLDAIVVEAIGMFGAEWLSEKTDRIDHPLVGAGYVLLGVLSFVLVPLLPFRILNKNDAITASIILSLTALIGLGWARSLHSWKNAPRTILEVIAVVLGATLIGLGVNQLRLG